MKDYAMEINTQTSHIYIVTTADDEKTARRQIVSDLKDIDLSEEAQTQSLSDVSNQARIF